MDKLVQVIKEKAQFLSETNLPDLHTAEFLEQFLDSFNLDNVESYVNINKLDYLRAVLLINNIDMDFDEFINTTELIAGAINNPNLQGHKWSGYVKSLNDLYDLDALEDCSPNSSKVNPKFNDLYDKFRLRDFDKSVFTFYQESDIYEELIDDDCNEENNDYIDEYIEIYDYSASSAMIKLFKCLPEPELFECINEVNILKDCVKVYYDTLEEKLNEYSINRESNKVFNKIKQSVRKTVIEILQERDLEIFKYCEQMRQFCLDVYKKEKEIRTETNRKIGKLKKLYDKVITASPKTVITLDNEMRKLLIDWELEYYYLLFVLNHNLDIRIIEEYKNLDYNNNSITKLDIVFSKYGLSFNDIDEEKQKQIAILDVKGVEEIVKQIRYSELLFITEYSDLFANVLISSNLHIIKVIDNCLKNKIINKEFILFNSYLLYDLEKFNKFFNNVTSLINSGINLTHKGFYNILLLDNNTLTNQLNILGEYKVRLYDESFSNYELFINCKLLDYLDNFIELGYGDVALDNLRYLNEESENILKRIMISHLIGLSPLNSNKKFIGQITSGNSFYVSPKEYDKYIIDYKDKYQNKIKYENIYKLN